MNAFAMIVSLLGMPLGYLLANAVPEEASAGRRYFVLAERIMFTVIVLIYSYASPLFLLLLLALFFPFRPILVFVLFILFPDLVAASAVFVYGLVVGTGLVLKIF